MTEWIADAACRGMTCHLSAWQHERAEALAVCARCPVIAECRLYAAHEGLVGVVVAGEDLTTVVNPGETAKRLGVKVTLRCIECRDVIHRKVDSGNTPLRCTECNARVCRERARNRYDPEARRAQRERLRQQREADLCATS